MVLEGTVSFPACQECNCHLGCACQTIRWLESWLITCAAPWRQIEWTLRWQLPWLKSLGAFTSTLTRSICLCHTVPYIPIHIQLFRSNHTVLLIRIMLHLLCKMTFINQCTRQWDKEFVCFFLFFCKVATALCFH